VSCKTLFFRNRLQWVLINEVHLVSAWGKDFRKSYAILDVRYWVGEKVWFGCTDAQRRICDFAGFKEDTQIVRTLIDRPDIAFIREVVKNNEKLSFRPLYFVISRFTGFKSVR
jgi:superfamily II DNA helicase RecQ